MSIEQNIKSEDKKEPIMPVWGRVLLVIFAFLIVTGFFQMIGSVIAGVPMDINIESGGNLIREIKVEQHVVVQFFGFVGLLLLIYVFRKGIDGKSVKSMGFSFKGRVKDVFAGIFVPIVIIGGGSLLLHYMGYVRFSDVNLDVNSMVFSFILFLIVAFNEEILFRGYILNNLMLSMNKYVALLISSFIFALFHGLNPNLTLLAFTDLIIAGLLLGISYIYTKNLWFPISLHLFWNFFQGPILGYQVSGQKGYSLIRVKTYGDQLFSGGEFGFEGSIICTALSAVTIILVILYYTRMKASTAEI